MGFPATHLSLVRRAASDDSDTRARAEEALATVYWAPIYTHVRLSHRQAPADAEDLTQGFFVDALRRGLFARYDPERARFRTYVRRCVDSYVSNALEAEGRLKRGGAAAFVSIEAAEIESRLTSETHGGAAGVEAVFQREWVRSVFTGALRRLRERYRETGRIDRLALFERYDLADSDDIRPTYAELAEERGLRVTQVTNWLAAVRRDFRAIVLDIIRELSGSEDEFRADVRDLLGIEPQ
ncbi:MAG TPA: sigma factor [Gemmatimonadaceae bacterium]|nr:sigma factor [Gemmatimonadaceae bacterium]